MWHYNANGTAQGPVDESVILRLIASGQINAGTLVWQTGQADWLPAGQSALAQHFSAATSFSPPPPPLYGNANPYAAPQFYGSPNYGNEKPTPLTWLQIGFSFEGRILRWQWWVSLVFQIVLFVGMAFSVVLMEEHVIPDVLAGILIFILVVIAIWFRFATSAKRWHDRGKSGWMSLIYFIPIVGPIWTLVECGFLEGTFGPNEFGGDPR